MTVGEDGERAAAEHLKGKGFQILERRWRSPEGEIDLIALDEKTVVFVEVKSRGSNSFGGAAAALKNRQRGRIIRAAIRYLRTSPHGKRAVRFDMIAIGPQGLRHIPGAFSAEGYTR